MKLQQFAKIKPTPPKSVENIREINKNITDNITISTLYLKLKTKNTNYVCLRLIKQIANKLV